MARTVPYRFVPNTTADADQVNADFDAILGFFGDIRDSDVSVAADLDGNKLSPTAGKRVPETRLENNAASSRVVASDPNSPGSDALRAISGDHVKTWTIAHVSHIIPPNSITGAMLATGAAIANLAAASVALDKLKVTIHTVAFSDAQFWGASTPMFFNKVANPSVSFPKATYELLGVFFKNLAFSGGAAQEATVSVIPDDSGANWAGRVRYVGQNSSSTTVTLSGTVVYVFISKV